MPQLSYAIWFLKFNLSPVSSWWIYKFSLRYSLTVFLFLGFIFVVFDLPLLSAVFVFLPLIISFVLKLDIYYLMLILFCTLFLSLFILCLVYVFLLVLLLLIILHVDNSLFLLLLFFVFQSEVFFLVLNELICLQLLFDFEVINLFIS